MIRTPSWRRTNTNDADFKFGVARAKITAKAPYFGTILYALVPIEVDKIRRVVQLPQGAAVQEMDTFGVTENGLLLYTKKALEKFSEENLVFVLAHEVMHVMLQHGFRCRTAGYDPQLFNIAADIFINDQLRAGGWPEAPPTFCWPESWGFDPGLTADEYYYLLQEKKQEQQQKKDDREQEGKCPQCGGAPHDEEGEGEGEQDGEDDGDGQDGDEGGGSGGKCPDQKPGEIDGEPDLTNMGEGMKGESFGQCGSAGGNSLENEDDLSAEGREAARSEAEMDTVRKQAAEQLAEHAQKHPGSVPAGLERWVSDILGPPKVDWRSHLRRAARRCYEWATGHDDYRYGSPHRRQAGYGWGRKSIILPKMITPVPQVLVAVDTSGSMGKEELEIGMRELDGIFKRLRTKVTICSVDAEVHELKPVSNWKEAARALKGGGGTSFVPIFEAVETMRQKPDIVVVVTDGWGPAPELEPTGYKTIWLEVGHDSTSPCEWGEHIKLED